MQICVYNSLKHCTNRSGMYEGRNGSQRLSIQCKFENLYIINGDYNQNRL